MMIYLQMSSFKFQMLLMTIQQFKNKIALHLYLILTHWITMKQQLQIMQIQIHNSKIALSPIIIKIHLLQLLQILNSRIAQSHQIINRIAVLHLFQIFFKKILIKIHRYRQMKIILASHSNSNNKENLALVHWCKWILRMICSL
jgi:hypothetical protein